MRHEFLKSFWDLSEGKEGGQAKIFIEVKAEGIAKTMKKIRDGNWIENDWKEEPH